MDKYRAALEEVKRIPEPKPEKKSPRPQGERLSPRMKALENEIAGLATAIRDVQTEISKLMTSNERVPASGVVKILKQEIADLEKQKKALEEKIIRVTPEEVKEIEIMEPEPGTKPFPRQEAAAEFRAGPRSIFVGDLSDLTTFFSDFNKLRAEGILKLLRDGDAVNAAVKTEALFKSERQLAERFDELRDTITRAIDSEVEEMLPKGLVIKSVEDLLKPGVAEKVANILKQTVGYDPKKYLKDVAEYERTRKELQSLNDFNRQIKKMLKENAAQPVSPRVAYPGATSVLARRAGSKDITSTGIAGSESHLARRGALAVMGAPTMEGTEKTAEELAQKVVSVVGRLEDVSRINVHKPLEQANKKLLLGLPLNVPTEAGTPSYREQLRTLSEELENFELGYGQTEEGKTHLDMIRADLRHGFELIDALLQKQREVVGALEPSKRKFDVSAGRRSPAEIGTPVRLAAGGVHEGLDIGSLIQDLRDLSAKTVTKDVQAGAQLNVELHRLNAEKTLEEITEKLEQLRKSIFSRSVDDDVKTALADKRIPIPASIADLRPLTLDRKGTTADNGSAVEIAKILQATTQRNPKEYLAGIRQYFEFAEQAAALAEDRVTESMKIWQDMTHDLETARVLSSGDFDPAFVSNEHVRLQALQEKVEDLELSSTSEIGQRLGRKFFAAEKILQDLEKATSVMRYRTKNSARIAEAMEFFGQGPAAQAWNLINAKIEGMISSPDSRADLEKVYKILDNAAEPATEYLLLLTEIEQGERGKDERRKLDQLNGIIGINKMQLDLTLKPQEKPKPAQQSAVRKGNKK